MSHRPANDMMEYQEMIDMEQNKRQTRLYAKTDGDNTEKISVLIDTTPSELSDMVLSNKISLNDTQTVRRKTMEYLKACKEAGTLPSKIGLSRCFGVSRQATDDFMKRNASHETSQFLEIVFDSFSELLTSAALCGASNTIMSIFISKSLYQYRDNSVIEIKTQDRKSVDYEITDDDAARYAKMLED